MNLFDVMKEAPLMSAHAADDDGLSAIRYTMGGIWVDFPRN